MSIGTKRTPILGGESGATVFRVQSHDGETWIEKSGSAEELSLEAAVLEWCAEHLPVPKVLVNQGRSLTMSVIPGFDLSQVSMQCAATVMNQALTLIHSIPIYDCPFHADWKSCLQKAESRVYAGLVDTNDFDEVNRGRSAFDVLAELKSQRPSTFLTCFTHGDACFPNFLAEDDRLTGIIDLGRAGIAHPTRDWALALRSMRHQFGEEGERIFRPYLPHDCADPGLLRMFCLMDELF